MEGMFVIHCFLIKWGWGSSAEKVIQHAFVMYTYIIDLCLHQEKERMSFKYTFIYLHKVFVFFFYHSNFRNVYSVFTGDYWEALTFYPVTWTTRSHNSSPSTSCLPFFT